MLLELESVRLNVIDEGAGHPVLFVHGLGANYRNTERVDYLRSNRLLAATALFMPAEGTLRSK